MHFYRNVFSHVPASKVREVSHMLKAIHAQETRATAEAKASAVVDGSAASVRAPLRAASYETHRERRCERV